MDSPNHLACLESDYRRLRAVAAGSLDAAVPSCPGWTVTDLVRHVAMVYLEKTDTMRTGVEQRWPPDLGQDDPIAALDATYAGLLAEFTARGPDEPTLTWYDPDQTVGFWVRRMAHETVIHRVDAELAAGVALDPIPAGLALDGIDEVLVCFLSFASRKWPDHLGEPLSGSDGRSVSIDAGTARWTVRLAPEGVEVTRDGPDGDARVAGSPDEVLLWSWRRAEAVRRDGDGKLVARLRDLLGATTT